MLHIPTYVHIFDYILFGRWNEVMVSITYYGLDVSIVNLIVEIN